MLLARNEKGFTLLEVLIAIVITALIGLGSWQILNSAIVTSERTADKTEELSQLQRSMMLIARDLQQILPRPIRDEYGDIRPALVSANDEIKIEFTRAGWRNPLNDPRSELQRVAYVLNDEQQLQRHYWRVIDRAQDSQPREQTLLGELETLEVDYMNDSGGWTDEWPPEASQGNSDPYQAFAILPKAIRLRMEHKAFGEITRLFEVVRYVAHQEVPTSQGGGGTNENNDTGDNDGSGENSGSQIGTGSDEAEREES